MLARESERSRSTPVKSRGQDSIADVSTEDRFKYFCLRNADHTIPLLLFVSVLFYNGAFKPFQEMFRLKLRLLNISIFLIILSFLIFETEAICVSPWCTQAPQFIQDMCCNFNSDCCSSAKLGDNPNCIKVSVANN